MASLLGVGIVATFIAAEPIENLIAPRTLRDAVVIPFTDFFRRRGALEMLLFIIFYKIGDAMALGLSTNFMLGLGFSKTEIGAISKGFGLAATLVGGLLGGAMVAKLGMKRALLIFGFFQGISVLLFAVLASVGKVTALLALTIGVENLCSGMGTAAFTAFLMMLCNRSFTATQYALLSSLASMNRVYASSVTGHIVAALGWEWFFVVCTAAALPALVLVYLRYDSWMVDGDGTASSRGCP
jgi:PAT family beta-lactamase induction signal transducer AmpG